MTRSENHRAVMPLFVASKPRFGLRAQSPWRDSSTSVSALFRKCLANRRRSISNYLCESNSEATVLTLDRHGREKGGRWAERYLFSLLRGYKTNVVRGSNWMVITGQGRAGGPNSALQGPAVFRPHCSYRDLYTLQRNGFIAARNSCVYTRVVKTDVEPAWPGCCQMEGREREK